MVLSCINNHSQHQYVNISNLLYCGDKYANASFAILVNASTTFSFFVADVSMYAISPCNLHHSNIFSFDILRSALKSALFPTRIDGNLSGDVIFSSEANSDLIFSIFSNEFGLVTSYTSTQASVKTYNDEPKGRNLC